MCKKCTTPMNLPHLQYDEPQKCCVTCEAGGKASRYIEKVPLSQRRNKKPKAQDMAADAVGNAVGKLGKGLKGLTKGVRATLSFAAAVSATASSAAATVAATAFAVAFTAGLPSLILGTRVSIAEEVLNLG